MGPEGRFDAEQGLGSPDTTLELSRDYEASNSPDPQDGRAEVSCPDFKRAESAESAESSKFIYAGARPTGECGASLLHVERPTGAWVRDHYSGALF